MERKRRIMCEAIIVGIFTLAGVGLTQLFNEIRAHRQAKEGDRRVFLRDRLKAYSRAKVHCSKLRENMPPEKRIAGSATAGWTDPFQQPFEIASEYMEWWKEHVLFLDDQTNKTFYEACNIIIVYCGKQLERPSFLEHPMPEHQNIKKFIEDADKALVEGAEALTKGC